MDAGADAVSPEVGLERVAAGGADHKEVPHGFGPRGDEGQGDHARCGQGCELIEITSGEGSAAGIPRGEMREFCAEEGGLEFAEARVEAEVVIVITHL